MRKLKSLEEVYDVCAADGFFNEDHNLNSQKVKDLIENADTSIASANLIIKAIDKRDKCWMNVYIDYYEALRMCAEAFLHINHMKISNHQCLFAYLCVKFPELDLDWNFFEKVRIKRNGASYYGEKINYEDWKAAELQIKLYISTLKKEIDKRLK
jgi:hypothetical protein